MKFFPTSMQSLFETVQDADCEQKDDAGQATTTTQKKAFQKSCITYDDWIRLWKLCEFLCVVSPSKIANVVR